MFSKSRCRVNAKQKDGATALMMASGHLEVVKVLLEKGADVNAKQNEGATALMAASAKKHVEVENFLKAHGAK